jgi:hypothetical protein
MGKQTPPRAFENDLGNPVRQNAARAGEHAFRHFRSGNAGLWSEREIVLDKSLFQKGSNAIKQTIPGGAAINGIMYDYLRLETME